MNEDKMLFSGNGFSANEPNNFKDSQTTQDFWDAKGDRNLQGQNSYHKIVNTTQAKLSAHEGKRYSCDQCDYKATQKSSLIRHQQSVNKGIKYSCNQCDYKATQQSGIKIH